MRTIAALGQISDIRKNVNRMMRHLKLQDSS
jgi:hypothetical protein